jgi:hypothetical protein
MIAHAEWTGAVAALATFGGVWAGHVGVRAVEYRARRLGPAMAILAAAGLGIEALAAVSGAGPAAAAEGIVGMTLLFDAFELRRQFRRVREGRARANPSNPRHAPFIASGRALAADPLDRDRALRESAP